MQYFSVSVRSGLTLAIVLSTSWIAGLAGAHGGSLNQQALDACLEKQHSEGCQYEGHHNDLYIGTCQYVSEEDLICVRNKPIQSINPELNEEDTAHTDEHSVGDL
jgi:hypothetical protein